MGRFQQLSPADMDVDDICPLHQTSTQRVRDLVIESSLQQTSDWIHQNHRAPTPITIWNAISRKELTARLLTDEHEIV